MSDNPQARAIVTEHHIDLGAQVGIARNVAFASGGRTHRLLPMAYYTPRPAYQAPTGTVTGVTSPQASS
jgi:hypothetical protein